MSRAAWIATTAAIAPLLSLVPMFDRYMMSGQRLSETRVAANDERRARHCAPGTRSQQRLAAAAAARLAAAAVARFAALAGDFTLLGGIHCGEATLALAGHLSLPCIVATKRLEPALGSLLMEVRKRPQVRPPAFVAQAELRSRPVIHRR